MGQASGLLEGIVIWMRALLPPEPQRAVDRDPARIDRFINSHFHFDHIGGNARLNVDCIGKRSRMLRR